MRFSAPYDLSTLPREARGMGERDALLSSFADSARSSTDGSGDATVHVQTGQQQRHREKRNANAGNGLNGFVL